MDQVSAAICELLEREHGVPRKNLKTTSRLAQDLGIDGDDAVEFVEQLHQKFGTDFTALREQWSDFFEVEGTPIGTALTGLACLAAIPLLVGVVAELRGKQITLAMVALVVLILAAIWLRRGDRKRPVTIAGLAEIIGWGAWPVDPKEVC
jgi:acyl carrier protein